MTANFKIANFAFFLIVFICTLLKFDIQILMYPNTRQCTYQVLSFTKYSNHRSLGEQAIRSSCLYLQEQAVFDQEFLQHVSNKVN